MAKHEISFGLKGADIGKELKKAQLDEEKKMRLGAGVAGTGFQAKQIDLLIKTIKENTEAVKKMSPQPGGAQAGAIPGATARVAGGGVGKMMGAGGALGALGFILDKTLEIGQKNIQKRMEQIETMGVTGLLTSTVSSLMTISQSAEYLKARAMVRGTELETGEKMYRRQTAAQLYGAKYGVGAGEVGKTVGLLDVFGERGKGEETFAKIADILSEGGIQTQLPIVIREMTGAMEEAFREGLDSSEFATGFADQIANMTMLNLGRTQSAIATVKKEMNIQKAVEKGEFGSYAAYQMYKAGESMLGRKDIQEMLVQQGLLAEGEDATKVTAYRKRAFVQRISAIAPEEQRKVFGRKMVEQFGQIGKTPQERLANFLNMMQDLKIEERGISAQNIYEEATGKTTRKGEALTGKQESAMKNMAITTDYTQVLSVRNQLDAAMLSEAANRIGDTTVRINTSLIKMAETLGGKSIPAIDTLNMVIDGAGMAINKFKGLLGIGEEKVDSNTMSAGR